MVAQIGRSTERDAERWPGRTFVLSFTACCEIMSLIQQLGLKPGELVEVRSELEILDTLDDATLDGLPFMPEMLAYCGRQYRVYKRADKTCDTVSAERGLSLFRRMERTVHLTMLRCDGAAHGGCQTGCLMFWKEAWLRRASARREPVELNARGWRLRRRSHAESTQRFTPRGAPCVRICRTAPASRADRAAWN